MSEGLDISTASDVAVLRALAIDGPQTRSQLAARFGISVATVANVLGPLLDAGALVEGQVAVQNPGRRPLSYSLAPDRGYVVGLIVHPAGVDLAAFDLQWRTVATRTLEQRLVEQPADAIVAVTCDLVADLFASPDLWPAPCLGVGCGVWGSVRDPGKTVLFWPYRRDLVDVPLAAHLATRLALPVVVDDGVRHLARELRYAHPGALADDFLFVAETGGFAAVLGGAVHRPASGLGGELAHVVVDPGGPLCQCGNRGCLLAVTAADALLHRVASAGVAGMHPALRALLGSWSHAPARAAEAAHVAPLSRDGASAVSQALRTAAAEGDRLAIRLLQEVGTAVGVAAATAINLLGVDTVFVRGYAVSASAVAQESLLRAIHLHVQHVLSPDVKVTFVQPTPNDGLLGAARHGLSHAFSQPAAAARTREILLGSANGAETADLEAPREMAAGTRVAHERLAEALVL